MLQGRPQVAPWALVVVFAVAGLLVGGPAAGALAGDSAAEAADLASVESVSGSSFGWLFDLFAWPIGGQNVFNTRYQHFDKIRKNRVDDLAVQWTFQTAGNISATATVDWKYVYITDFGGFVYKLRRSDGSVVWQVSVGDVTGVPGNFSRSSPVLYRDKVILGDMGGFAAAAGARAFALDRETGETEWVTMIDNHQAAMLTGSQVVYKGVVYGGVSSIETLFAIFPGYPCCTFRGSAFALDVDTGELLWKTFTTPESPPGHNPLEDGPLYSGAPIWGSTPSIDPFRNSVYLGTGQNYTLPAPVLACIEDANNSGGDPALCNAPDNYFDSILSFDLDTGAIKWGQPAIPFDAWNVSCLGIGPPENCPSPTGPDFDFGQAPLRFRGKHGKVLVGAGQKSGIFWAHDPNTGDVEWSTVIGPGGLGGGIMWGSAYDGRRIYVAEGNSDGQLWTLTNPASDSAATTTGGGWTALDPKTGDILWQTAEPNGGIGWSPVTVTRNGLLFACSMDDDGHMYALDTATGERLWSFASGASCVAGAAVVGKNVYWGSGYVGPGNIGVPGNTFYAFELQ